MSDNAAIVLITVAALALVGFMFWYGNREK